MTTKNLKFFQNPVLALIIANIIWGAASPIFKYSLESTPPFILAFMRFFLPALIFPFLYKKNILFEKADKKTWFYLLLAAFFGITLNISMFFLGIKLTQSINAPIIASAGPVFLFIFSIIFLKEKLRMKVLGGMMIAFFGVLFIILSPILFDGQKYHLGEIKGNIFLLIATFGAVLYSLFNKIILKKINSIMATFWQFLIGSLTFLPMAIYELTNWNISMLDIKGAVGIVFGALFSSLIAFLFYNYGLSKIKAEEVGVFSYICPVTAVVIAVPLLSEYPDQYFFIGAFLVFAGIFIAEGRVHWHPIYKLQVKS